MDTGNSEGLQPETQTVKKIKYKIKHKKKKRK